MSGGVMTRIGMNEIESATGGYAHRYFVREDNKHKVERFYETLPMFNYASLYNNRVTNRIALLLRNKQTGVIYEFYMDWVSDEVLMSDMMLAYILMVV